MEDTGQLIDLSVDGDCISNTLSDALRSLLRAFVRGSGRGSEQIREP
jgi:hypothetical protein